MTDCSVQNEVGDPYHISLVILSYGNLVQDEKESSDWFLKFCNFGLLKISCSNLFLLKYTKGNSRVMILVVNLFCKSID